MQREGPLRVAAYVQEGWIAADAWLEDPAVERRLRKALPRHVAWLLRTQRPDGSWDTGRDEETTRTLPIVGFLVWYDQRFGPRADVRAAVQRASAAFADTERWSAIGWFRNDEHAEVMRALAGRPLATLAANRFVMP